MSIRVNKTKLILLGVAVVCMVAGIVLVMLAPTSHDVSPSKQSSFPFVVLLPIYTSLIPLYIAAARRHKNKSDG